MTGYQYYVNEQKPKIKMKDSSLTDILISKQLAKQWKELTKEEQQKYIEQGKECKAS